MVPLPAERRFAAVSFPSVAAGIGAIRRALQLGHRPSVVRMYDEEATRLASRPSSARKLDGVYTVLAFEGERAAVDVEARAGVRARPRAGGGRANARARRSAGGTAATTSTTRRTTPSCRRSGGRSTSSATYSRIDAVYAALQAAVRGRYARHGLQLRMHLSHWYAWGTMVYGRFVFPTAVPDALELHDRIWEDAMTAAGRGRSHERSPRGGHQARPYMRRQHGGRLDAMRQIKAALDPNGIMNPGKMGL